MKIDRLFFRQHQKLLLKIANCWYLRWVLGLHNVNDGLLENKIDLIQTNSIRLVLPTIDGKAQRRYIFYTEERFAETLASNISPFYYISGIFNQKRSWHFSPVGVLGLLFLGLFGKLVGAPAMLVASTSYEPALAGCGNIVISNQATWAAAIGATSATAQNAGAGGDWFNIAEHQAGGYACRRGFMPVDTTGITGTITSAVWNVKISDLYNGKGGSCGFVESTQASNTTLANSDYDNIGATLWSDSVTYAAMTDETFTQWTLNPTGIAAINTSGFTKFANTTSFDIGASDPGAANGLSGIQVYYHDNTANDPYLDVTVASNNSGFLMFM